MNRQSTAAFFQISCQYSLPHKVQGTYAFSFSSTMNSVLIATKLQSNIFVDSSYCSLVKMYLCIYYIWKCGVSLSSSQLYWHITCLIPTFTISQPNGIVSTDYKKYMKHKTFLTAQNGIRIITFSSRSKHEESLTRDHQEVSCIHRWYGGMEALMTLSNLSIAASRFLFLLFALPTKPLFGSICFYKLGQILS